MQEMRVQSLGQEDPLEKEMATHSRILAWEIPWTEEPGGLQFAGLQRVGHNLATKQQQHTGSCYCSVVKSCLTLCDPMGCSTPGFPVLHYLPELLKLLSIESMMPSNHLILCRPLLLPSVFLSIRIFPNESTLPIRWPKYWRFCFSISPSNEYSGLISFRIDWFDLLEVQGTLKSLLRHHNLKASILQRSSSLWSNAHICTWLMEKP